MIQIGARNMQNFALLTEVGQTRKPVLLKRGMSATVEDLLMSAEYILSQGNPHVVLCERGVKSFDTATRAICTTWRPCRRARRCRTCRSSSIPAMPRAGRI